MSMPAGGRDVWIEDAVALPSTLSFTDPGAVDWGAVRTVAVVGPRAAMVQAGALLPLGLRPSYDTLLRAAEERPYDVDVVRQLVVPQQGGVGAVGAIFAGVVSGNASRHVCPARPDQVARFVRKARGMGAFRRGTLLILAVPSREYVAAYAAAAARGHPLCSLKGAHEGWDPDRETVQCAAVINGVSVPNAALREAGILATSVQLAARLTDTPTNYLDTRRYCELLRRMAGRLGCGVRVLFGDEVAAAGMNVLYAVGRAAEQPAALVILSHHPTGADPDDAVCFVGKGIVYDTGGLAIKHPVSHMRGMKYDMAGSAAVLGAFVATVRAGGPPRVLHAVLALADNAVGPLSLRNDDVVRCLSGKTIEVNNTDAEGRLILSDAVAYCRAHLRPKAIVDIATLTGAQGIATGKHFAAVLSNTDAAERAAVATGRVCGDMCHPVPYAPELLLPEFASKVADMTNSVANRSNAQVSCAGLFIKHCGLPGYDATWLHVDMAECAIEDGRATGYGVSLLYHLRAKL